MVVVGVGDVRLGGREGGREVSLGCGKSEQERGYLGSPGKVTSPRCIGRE